MSVTADPLSKAVPPPDRDTDELILLHRCRTAYEEAKAAKRVMYPTWRRNLMLLNNRSWSDFRMAWMPSPSDSEIYPICADLIGWLTDQSVMYTVAAAAQANTPWYDQISQLADDLEVILQSNWKVRNQQGMINLALWDAILCGAGILKAVWDQALEKGLGDATMVRVDPWNFYPDPTATNEEDAEYFVEVRRMSWTEVERRFPDTCDRLLSDLVYDGSESQLDSDQRPMNTRATAGRYPMTNMLGYPTHATSVGGLPGQGRRSAFKPEGILVYELWRRENRMGKVPDPHFTPPEGQPDAVAPEVDVPYDDWRVIVWSSETVLLDCWASDLWDGATHPYSRLVTEDTGEFWPTALVTHMAPAQIAINRLLAALQQSAELTGNPVFLEPATAGIGQTLIVNRPGQRLRVQPAGMQGGGGPQWLTPPAMSPDVLGLIRFWIERMENISGLSTITKGKGPNARTPEAVVNQVQESGFVRVRAILRNLERALRRLGQIQAQLIVENYTQPRILSVVGPDGGQSAVILRERHFIDAVNNEYAPFKYALIINAGSDVPTSRQARMAEAQTLFAVKLIDRQAALEMMSVPHWQQIESRMEQADAAAAQAAQSNQATSRARTGRRS